MPKSALQQALEAGDMNLAAHILVLAVLKVAAAEAASHATPTPSGTASTAAPCHQLPARPFRKPVSSARPT